MTIQEQANAILQRTDTDELMLRLVQDRAALLAACKANISAVGRPAADDWLNERGYADACEAYELMLAAIAQAERP